MHACSLGDWRPEAQGQVTSHDFAGTSDEWMGLSCMNMQDC